jgi:hypothetical protein
MNGLSRETGLRVNRRVLELNERIIAKSLKDLSEKLCPFSHFGWRIGPDELGEGSPASGLKPEPAGPNPSTRYRFGE